MKPIVHRTVILVTAIIVVIGVYTVYNVNQTIRNSYAVWWVADMVIEHLKSNDNNWPVDWNDLRDDFQVCVERSGQPWTFDELQNRVTVDFDINGPKLKDSAQGLAKPNFCVIWLTDGTDSHWASREPNTKILNYFNGTTPADPVVTGFGGSSAE